MIPAAAVKAFLSKPRDDFRPLKKLTHAQIDRMLDRLDPPPVFWHGLGLHQKVALYLGLKHKSFAMWLDMGVGKSLISLELLQYWWDTKQFRRALIFVTSDKAFPTWERQVKQFQIKIPFVSLDVSASDEKWRLLDNFGDGLIFLTYPGTVAMLSERVKKKKKIKWVISDKKLRRLLKDVDALVMDESTRVSNPGSLAHKICRAASRQAQFRYALAGMPFGRDPTPLWAQMYLVDHGETLGPTLGLFRGAFFTEKDSYWGGPYSKDYTFKQNLKPVLSRILQHRSLTYTADECIDLPPVRRLIEEVRLPLDTREYYRRVVDDLIAAKGNFRAIKNAFLRMRQLSSGFMGLKDDETGDRAEIEFESNPKLDRLIELADALPEEAGMVVFYEYTWSGRKIVKTLQEELGYKTIWLWSGTKDVPGALNTFISGKAKVAVINSKVGAMSIDGLQKRANYLAMYESPLSVIDRSQAEKRLVRQGQLHKVFIYDLVVKDTVDEAILSYHAEGEALFDALLRDPERVLRPR